MITRYDLSFDCGEESLAVRRFSLREAISTPFELSILASSPNDDLSIDAFVGHAAALSVLTEGGARVFRGTCDVMEQVSPRHSERAEYFIRIVPDLRLLEHRTDYRIFQHQNVPSIAKEILSQWGIEVVERLEVAHFPELEYRVQHGETDFSFVTRLLEEAGISYFFETAAGESSLGKTMLVLVEAPHAAPARPLPIMYIEQSGVVAGPFVRSVKVRGEVRPGRATIRDFDFRKNLDYQLFGRARTSVPEEDRFEAYRYEPGAFVVEGPGPAHTSEPEGAALAVRRLAADRFTRQTITFDTNVFDLAPGSVFSIARHPRTDLGLDKRLLVTELTTEYVEGEAPAIKARAVFAEKPFFPPRTMTKPRVRGLESAIVVGPPGEEIHTDEYGRVRVQFHWDRLGQYDEKSSCWIRVSQGWAGGAYGLINLPRVGNEVIVGFWDGDPDQPLIVGRLFNGPEVPPNKLPEHRTRSTWRSNSSPGGDGFNELTFEDAKGNELVFIRAERDHERMVRHDESVWVGNDRKKTVTKNETVFVGSNRGTTVTETDVTEVGKLSKVTIDSRSPATAANPTGLEMSDGRVILTSGLASLTLDGENASLNAAGSIFLNAKNDIALRADATITASANVNLTLLAGASLTIKSAGGDVSIQGGPVVRINPEPPGKGAAARLAMQAEDAERSIDVPSGSDIEASMTDAEEHARYTGAEPRWFSDKLKPGGAWDFEKSGPRYASYAAFHLGVVGRALGLPEGAVLRQAGALRLAKGTSNPDWGDPGNGVSGGTYPYGASPEDQEMVQRGGAHYDAYYGG